MDDQDAIAPGLALRVSSTGNKSFVLAARYPTNPRNPTRRAIGKYGAITPEEARVKAWEWLQLLNKGVDPKTEEAKQRAAALRPQQNNFKYVAEEFLKRYVTRHHCLRCDKRFLLIRPTPPPARTRQKLNTPINTHSIVVNVIHNVGTKPSHASKPRITFRVNGEEGPSSIA